MVSFYFPLWVVEEKGAKELVFSASLSISMIGVALLMPVCGAMSDARGTRLRYLRWTTYGCVAATACIGLTEHLAPALGLFIVANVCYQLGTIFYDAMLCDIAEPQALGQASGIGASFGYLGSMVGLLCLWPFVKHGGHHAAFLPSALGFLVFAAPLLASREPIIQTRMRRPVIREAMDRLRWTLAHVARYPALMRLFLASFFSLNAINTILVFMVIYTKRVLHFDEGQVVRFFLWSQAFAIAGSLVGGRIVQRFGVKRALMMIWLGWIGALTGVALGLRPGWLWVLGPVIGFCLGPTWAALRVFIIQLAPREQVAEFLGLAGLLGRASSILGPLLWGLIVWNPAHYRQAVMALVALLVMGTWILRRVPQPVGSS